MSDEKTIQELEITHGVLAEDRNKFPLDTKMSEAEFITEINEHYEDWRGCNHEDRIAFLKANDYEVTHENMLDVNLSAKPPVEEVPQQVEEEVVEPLPETLLPPPSENGEVLPGSPEEAARIQPPTEEPETFLPR